MFNLRFKLYLVPPIFKALCRRHCHQHQPPAALSTASLSLCSDGQYPARQRAVALLIPTPTPSCHRTIPLPRGLRTELSAIVTFSSIPAMRIASGDQKVTSSTVLLLRVTGRCESSQHPAWGQFKGRDEVSLKVHWVKIRDEVPPRPELV